MEQFFEQSPRQLEEWLDFIERDIENVRRAVNFIEEAGIEADFYVHEKSETVEESSEAMNIPEERIVKTLVFIAGENPVAVLAPGDSRIDEDRLEEVTGEDVRMANPDEVEKATGYVVGGVSPFDLEIPVFIEESVLEHEKVKPAAGSRVIGVELAADDLREATGAEPAELSE
ncbi:MAG: aminoacyl-tRNA deacylase [Candidatus Nanohaloarchaea archaeon]